jgi:methylmalonyl-CoA mutase N-terminal domain/subunit
VVVGVNKYVDPPERANIEIHRTDPQAEARQITRLRATRARRNNTDVERLLDRLAVEAGTSSTNLLPVTVELVKARASMGEIVQRLRAVYGSYVETPVF